MTNSSYGHPLRSAKNRSIVNRNGNGTTDLAPSQPSTLLVSLLHAGGNLAGVAEVQYTLAAERLFTSTSLVSCPDGRRLSVADLGENGFKYSDPLGLPRPDSIDPRHCAQASVNRGD